MPREMSVNAQHRFERYLAGKIHHVADEPEPIIFIDVGSVAVDEFRLAAFFSARNCLSSHWLLPFVYSLLLTDYKNLVGWKPPGAAAAAVDSRKKNYRLIVTIAFASHSGMLRLDCHSEASW